MPKRRDITDYIACYDERELVEGELAKALVIILRTGGCSWSKRQGCFMCGYGEDAHLTDVPADTLLTQFEAAMQKFDGHNLVKIFNSGSFLDDSEVPEEARTRILEVLAERDVKVVFESRPEFITEQSLEQVKSITGKVEVALGLETASDTVRAMCVNKGFNFDEYLSSARLIRAAGFRVRTYLLLKPPFLSEGDAVEDVWHSMEQVREHTDVISINPVNVQKGTLVEKLWRSQQYRPPWLWSLLELFKRLRSWRDIDAKVQVISHPSGAGTKRGIHNCR
ncbi:MAG: archaeosine biosynthesis radical SAM protein RaSEA, partial [Thermoplasmata archaeon]